MSAEGAPDRTPTPTPTRARSRRESPASFPPVDNSSTSAEVSTATSGTSPPSMRRLSAAAVLNSKAIGRPMARSTSGCAS